VLDKPRQLIEYVADRPGHDYRYAVDTTKIRALGWAPAVDFRAGVESTARWYQDRQDWWRPLKSGEYWDYYRRNYRPLPQAEVGA
jgi:dTDP-glucose 4,6-dehydratase